MERMKSDDQIRSRVNKELADIFIYALTLAHEFGFDPAEVVLDKILTNEKKYLAEKMGLRRMNTQSPPAARNLAIRETPSSSCANPVV